MLSEYGPRSRKRERQFIRWEIHFKGDLLVSAVKASPEAVELVREGAIAGWGHSTGWFEVCDGLYALPHAPGVQ